MEVDCHLMRLVVAGHAEFELALLDFDFATALSEAPSAR